MIIRITKEFRFEMAHALLDYDGPCRFIHGHSYRLDVTLKGTVNESGPKSGMVFDFSDLKTLVGQHIISVFDHALVLNSSTDDTLLRALGEHNLILVDFQPTCELLCAHFATILKAHLPARISLQNLTLCETATSCASWFAEDNS